MTGKTSQTIVNISFKNATKVFTGPLIAVNDRVSEEDFQELMTPELEIIKREIRSMKTRKINFFTWNEKQELEKVGKSLFEPLNIYWSMNGMICVLVYESAFLVYKLSEKKELFYYGQQNISVNKECSFENLGSIRLLLGKFVLLYFRKYCWIL
jgi:hypothetical protein